ncbi:MAG TPA: ABC transporter ATP-binding protein, partial [Nocardioides sp.]
MYALGRARRVTKPTAGTGGTPRGKASDLRRSLRLFRRFAGDRRPYWLGLALLAFEAGTSILEPIPIAFLIDFLQGARGNLRSYGAPELLSSARVETILLLTIAIVLIAVINSAADSLTEVCMARGGRSLGYRIRVAMYSHLQQLSLAYHDTKRTGDVLTRVTGDVLVVEDFVVKSVSNIFGSLLVLVGSFIFLLTQSWSVALVALIVIPMLALVSNYYSRRIKVASKTQRQREGELASTAQEMLTSIRLVQSYGRGTVDLEQFSHETGQSMRASLWAANIQAKFSFVISLVEALSIAAVVWLGVWLVDRDAITVGTLVLFVLLLQNMFKPARKIVSEWYKIGKVFASVERIDDLLDREIVVRDDPHALPAPPLEGRLSFRHVGFTYPAEHEDGSRLTSRPPVLTDIDFELAPGEVVSLVGFSGAGKSTIAQLVPRLYDADKGEVLVDGLRVQDVTLASLRSQISLVLQDTVLLSGSVSENIGYGIPDATPSDIERAARLANAHEFIMALPDGYETHLGERGSTLSGGQRQRLAIARAFIRRAPILILDEPTTGLDAESARSVVDALRSLMRGKSTIVISHDLGLIRCADRVLVIAEGRIVESGAHEQLIDRQGPYAELFTRQELHLEGTDSEDELTALTSAHQEGPADPPAARRPAGLADPLHRRLPGLAR